jgi:hypothetical protein
MGMMPGWSGLHTVLAVIAVTAAATVCASGLFILAFIIMSFYLGRAHDQELLERQPPPDVQVQVDGPFRGDLWRHVQHQRGVDVRHGHGVVGDRLDRDLDARLDHRLLHVLRGDPRRGHDTQQVVLLSDLQGEVEVEGVEDVGKRERQRAVPDAWQEDIAFSRDRVGERQTGVIAMGSV